MGLIQILNRIRYFLSTILIIFNILIEFYLSGYVKVFLIVFLFSFHDFSIFSTINLITQILISIFIFFIIKKLNTPISEFRDYKEYSIISCLIFILFSIPQLAINPLVNNTKFYTIKFNEKTITGEQLERNYFICNDGENTLNKKYSNGKLITEFEKKEIGINNIEFTEYYYSFKPLVLLKRRYLSDDIYLNDNVTIKSRDGIKNYIYSTDSSILLKLIFVPQLIFELLYFSVLNFILPISILITIIIVFLKFKFDSFKLNLSLSQKNLFFSLGLLLLIILFNYISNLEMQF